MEEYRLKRAALIQQSKDFKYDNLTFSLLEEQTNLLFRKILIDERTVLEDGFFQQNTLKHKEDFEKNSTIFQAIQRLPKGAGLNVNIDCILDIDWFIDEMAYSENTYFNQESNSFRYFSSLQKAEESNGGYQLLKKLRENSKDKQEFDVNIRKTLFIQHDECNNQSIDIYKIKQNKTNNLKGLIYFKDNFCAYLKTSMMNFIHQGVIHIEGRYILEQIFDEDNNLLTIDQEMKIFKDVISDIQVLHPQFTFLIIIQGLKQWTMHKIEDYLKQALNLKQKYPDLIGGFDLIEEQEDSSKSLLQLASVLIKKNKLEDQIGANLPFALHCGESINCLVNNNLFDAVLLGSKRITHGLNLIQHTFLLNQIKADKICLEMCPVSNQILRFTHDIRLHPIKAFLNYGIKVTINSDCPGLFGYNGLNHDYFFSSIGAQLDYKDLKRCVYNSIESSFMSQEQKTSAYEELEGEFQAWAKWFLETNSLN